MMKPSYGIAFAFCILSVFMLSIEATAEEFIKTPGETALYAAYSQYPEISRFLSRVDYQSPRLTVRIVGRTLPAGPLPAVDLLLCILTEEGVERLEDLDRNKPTFYLVAAKHGNEQSAKEAALRLVRDLALGELRPLLKQVNVLVLPTANPYGNWLDQRRNEQELDLNRDQVKLESPEAEAINRVFVTCMPEVTLDVHEKGDDYYQVNTGCVSHVNISVKLQDMSRNVIFPEVKKALAEHSYTFHEYLVTQQMGIDSSAGVSYAPRDLGERETMMRYSTTDLNDGRNSPGIYQTLSFIQEGASRHDLESLRLRSDYQYFGIRATLESVARHADEINTLVRDLRRDLLERAESPAEGDLVHLRMKYARDLKNPTLAIKRYERSRSPIRGILKVDKKAGDPVTVDDLARHSGPSDRRLVDYNVENWFPLVEPTLSVPRPLGYLVPAEYSGVIRTLHKHGLRLQILTADSPLAVEAYQITDLVPAEYDYLPPRVIEVESLPMERIARSGDIYVSCAQPGANLIPCLLEPQSQYGLIRYRRFKLVPEKGDFYPVTRVIQSGDLSLVPYMNWRQ